MGWFLMIHICYAISDERGNYSKFAGASMSSLLENTDASVTIHLLHDGKISGDNLDKFTELVQNYGQKIKFYNVPQLLADTLAKGREIFPPGFSSERYTEVNMYRLALGEVLSPEVEKALFLDADTIINMDIDELWQYSAGEAGLAAVSDWSVLEHFGRTDAVSENDSFLYKNGLADMHTVFNAGVLLMDLKKLRERGNLLLEGLKFLADYEGQWKFYDNDILIALFSQDFCHLPWNYNIRVAWARALGGNTLTKGIYHYVGRSYGLNPGDNCHKLFITYWLKTPWFNENTLYTGLNMSRAYTQTQGIRRLKAVRQIMNHSNRKKRVLMGLAVDEARLRADFSLKQDEKFVVLTPGQRMVLEYPVREYYYLVFWSNYQEARALMEQAGLREFEHFADGTLLMPEQTNDLVLGDLSFLWNI